MVIRCIGRVRANAWIGLCNLYYNKKRLGTFGGRHRVMIEGKSVS